MCACWPFATKTSKWTDIVAMAFTNAEKQRRFRARVNADPQRRAEFLMKQRLRQKQQKKKKKKKKKDGNLLVVPLYEKQDGEIQKFVDCIRKCAKNVIKGHVALCPHQMTQLRRKRHDLRALSKKKTSLWVKCRILQKDGFLTALLPPVSVLASLLQKWCRLPRNWYSSISLIDSTNDCRDLPLNCHHENWLQP